MGVPVASAGRRRRRAGVGELSPAQQLLVGWSDVKEYARRIDRAVELLNDDAVKQIVYVSPDSLDDLAEEWGEVDTSPEATMLRARATKRGAAQTARDLKWAALWNAFRYEW